MWDTSDFIHPFINGNGRTARALCYCIICLKANALLPGTPLLPELIRLNRPALIKHLKAADAGNRKDLTDFVGQLLMQQVTPSSSP